MLRLWEICEGIIELYKSFIFIKAVVAVKTIICI